MDPKDSVVAMVENAADHGTTFVIRHEGQNVAVLMPYDEYMRMVARLDEVRPAGS